jgi:hypothetical protein
MVVRRRNASYCRPFRGCAEYVSPFSINNPDGWQYWLIHFANNYRAPREQNNMLHDIRPSKRISAVLGFAWCSFDVDHDVSKLYLFEDTDCVEAKQQLMVDIPRLVPELGDVVNVGRCYGSI